MTSLNADIRTQSGKGAARKLRAAGKVPCTIYGPDGAPVSASVDPELLVEIFDQSKDRNTVVELTLNGAKVPCLVREAQRHPLTREIQHVDFYRVAADRDVEVVVPLLHDGKPAGAINGGRIRVIRRSINVRCKPSAIPTSLTVDVSPLDVGQSVKASDIPLPKGVALAYDDTEFFVLTCYGKAKQRGEKA